MYLLARVVPVIKRNHEIDKLVGADLFGEIVPKFRRHFRKTISDWADDLLHHVSRHLGGASQFDQLANFRALRVLIFGRRSRALRGGALCQRCEIQNTEYENPRKESLHEELLIVKGYAPALLASSP